MQKTDHEVRAKAPNARLLAASAGIRRQLKIQTIVLTIVGVEAVILTALRFWNTL